MGMQDEEPLAALTAAADQERAHAVADAQVIAAYRRQLIDEGLPASLANTLTVNFQRMKIGACTECDW